MKSVRPTCDRHPNLQMVPCWLKRGREVVPGHACPVPGCDRRHTQEGYLNASDGEIVMGPQSSVGKKGAGSASLNQKSILKQAAAGEDRPLNRHAAARAAILQAIEAKRQP